MPKFWLALLLLFSIITATSQQPVFKWAKAFSNPDQNAYSNCRSVEVDQQGNVYTAGLFQGTTDFDPGPGVFNLTGTGRGRYGIFISKLNSNGDFLWAIYVPALVEFGNIEISLDKSGNVYLVSELRDSIDMDPGPGVYMLNRIGAVDAFVAKYDPNGKLVWAKQFGGPGDTVPRSDVVDVDEDGNVIVCGNFNNTVDFDPGPNTFNMTSTAHIQSFVVKLTNNGDFIWARQLGNSPIVYSGAHVADVKCDTKGNIYAMGNFQGLCDFDPGPNVYTLQGTSMGDAYIAKLDANGQFVWARRIGNTTNKSFDFAQSWGIEVDANNNVYTTGNFTGTFDFDPGVNTHIVTSRNYDWYILKLNEQGNFVWVDVFGSTSLETGMDVALDNGGNIYAFGSVGDVTDMDPGPGVFNVKPQSAYGAAAMVKVDAGGVFLWAGLFEGKGSTSCKRMAVDDQYNIYFTGYMSGSIDYDPGPKIAKLDVSSDQTPFVAKLGRCTNITRATINVTTCTSYTLQNEIFDTTGTYVRTLSNSEGCDSIVTLNLIVTKRFTNQAIVICDGESFFVGGAMRTISGVYKDTLKTVLNCDSIVTTRLTVNPSPRPNLGPDIDLCVGTDLTINPGSFSKYQWQDMTTANDLKVNTPGSYWVKVTNNFNCSASDTLTVRTLLPSPSGFLKKTDSICSLQKLEIMSSQQYKEYLWSTGSVANKIQIESPGQYSLKVIDANGCIGTESTTVFKKECLLGMYLPSAFTPNNDGRNDLFKALVFGKIVAFKLQVFDRAGQLIFETTNPDMGWDGKNKGISYSNSVFVWQCSYQFEQQKPAFQKGTVMIVR